jgi:hypothetical protein
MINRVGRARSETGYLPTHHTHNLQVRCPSTGLRLSPVPEPPELKDLADIAHMRMDWARERFADPQYTEAMKRFGATTHLAHAENVLDALLRTGSVRRVVPDAGAALLFGRHGIGFRRLSRFVVRGRATVHAPTGVGSPR